MIEYLLAQRYNQEVTAIYIPAGAEFKITDSNFRSL